MSEFKRVIDLAHKATDTALPYVRRAEAAGELVDKAIADLVLAREAFHDPRNVGKMESFVKDSLRLAMMSMSADPSIIDLIAEVQDILGEERESDLP